MTRNLSPILLESRGLTQALRRLISDFVKTTGTRAALCIQNIDSFFTDDNRTSVYRIVQECLSNIGKHSGAKNVSLLIKKQNGKVSLAINDDGKGFDVGPALGKGLGLTIISERARMLNGTAFIRSQKGKGTEIHIDIFSEAAE